MLPARLVTGLDKLIAFPASYLSVNYLTQTNAYFPVLMATMMITPSVSPVTRSVRLVRAPSAPTVNHVALSLTMFLLQTSVLQAVLLASTQPQLIVKVGTTYISLL